MSKVSVIIPVYNVEKYLKECLDSVVNQTLKDIEIICVNDGSTDNSLQILEEYAIKDDRITVINQDNKGVGAARNIGLKLARGEYINFLDSDDYLDLQCYEKLYQKITEYNADLCQFGYLYVNNEKRVLNKTDFREIYENKNNGGVFNCFDEPSFVFNRTWGAPLRLYNREFFIQNVKGFPIGRWYEDVVVGVKSALMANRMVCVEEHLYFYRSTEGSIMHSTSLSRKCFDILEAIKDIENVLNTTKLFKEFEHWFFRFACNQISIFYYEKIKDKELKKEFKEKSKEYFSKFNLKAIIEKYEELYKFCPEFIYMCPKKLLLNIFSIKNHHNNMHKVITIFGIKLKIRRG